MQPEYIRGLPLLPYFSTEKKKWWHVRIATKTLEKKDKI